MLLVFDFQGFVRLPDVILVNSLSRSWVSPMFDIPRLRAPTNLGHIAYEPYAYVKQSSLTSRTLFLPERDSYPDVDFKPAYEHCHYFLRGTTSLDGEFLLGSSSSKYNALSVNLMSRVNPK